MKSIFKNLRLSVFAFLPILILMVFASCQNEESVVVNPQPEETIAANSNLANLMSRTSAFDGSSDDRLDYADCLALNLPVTITVNNITVIINTLDDIALIEDIINEFNTDDDVLEFLFPISITLNDHSTVVINDQDELDAFVNECTNQDDVIECIDFVYPISFSIYNANFQVLEIVTINNDQELYGFVDYLEDNYPAGIFASLNFPVTMVYSNGETIEVNNNQELEDAINAAGDDCSIPECNEQEVDAYLMECPWNVASYNGTDVFANYILNFNENQVLEILNGSTTQFIEGLWSTSPNNNNGVVLTISNINDTNLDELISRNWLVIECSVDRIVLESGQNILILEQNCTDYDCPDLQANIGEACETGSGVFGTINANCECEENATFDCADLEECFWYADTNLYETFVAEHFYFGSNNVVEIVNGITNELEDVGNYWLNMLPDGTQTLTLSFQQEPHDLISLEWEIVACSVGVIELVNGNDTLVFSQECNMFDCPSISANIGDACFDNQNQEGVINANCECEVAQTFDCPSIGANIGDACFDNQNQEGVINANCECEVTQTFDCPSIGANIGDVCFDNQNQEGVINANCECEVTQTFDCPSIGANIGDVCETSNGAEGVINTNCECEPNTNNPFVCFDEFTTITVCDEEDGVIDGAYQFNLDEFYTDCTHINDINITYYYTTQDAENQTNQFTSPWVNAANPDIIYSRIEHITTGAFVIYEIVIFVEVCNSEICSETQLGQYLSECTWNIEDYNGTNDLVNYTFDFNLDGTVIIESDNQVITATWTSETIQGQVYIEFGNVAGANIQAITGNWTVVFCQSNRIEMIRGTDFMYFVQTC